MKVKLEIKDTRRTVTNVEERFERIVSRDGATTEKSRGWFVTVDGGKDLNVYGYTICVGRVEPDVKVGYTCTTSWFFGSDD